MSEFCVSPSRCSALSEQSLSNKRHFSKNSSIQAPLESEVMPVVDGVVVALAPPDGYIVDFDHPQRNSVTAAYWLYGSGNLFMLIFMFQRYYVRFFIQKALQVEDYCLAVAYIFSVIFQTMIVDDFADGIMGTHAWEMPMSKFIRFGRALYVLPILYNPVQCGAKLALLVVYRRLAPQKWYQIMVWSAIFVVIASTIGLTFASIFPCKPLRASWDVTIVDATCIDRVAVYKSVAGVGAATDAMVLAILVPIIIPLQISIQQKIGLLCFFGLGAITVFTSIMRLVTLTKSLKTVDQSWGGGVVLLWICAEASLSIICATLTTVKPFARHFFPHMLGSGADDTSQRKKTFRQSVPISMGALMPSQNNRQNEYNRFDDSPNPIYPLTTMTNVEVGDTKARHHTRHRSGSHPDDSSSEKAIVQTRTMTLAFS